MTPEPGTDRLFILQHLKHLGRAGSPARRPRRPGRDRDRDSARDRRPRRRRGLPPRLRAQRLPLHRPERPDARAARRRPRCVRYTVDRRPPHRIDPASKLLIIEWPSNGHNGGDLAFGNDGYLYVSSGDGSSDSDANLTGQTLDDLLAGPCCGSTSITPTRAGTTAVPKDNPFVESPRRPARDLGLRPAQSLAAQLRPQVGPALGRPERPGPVGAGLPDQEGGQLRLERHRGQPHLPWPTARRAPTRSCRRPPSTRHSEARSLTGGRVYRGTQPARPGRGLRLRRLVHRPGLGHQARRHEGPLAPRAGRHPVQHHRLRHRPRRRAVRHRPAGRVLSVRADDRGRQAHSAVPDQAERDGPVRLGRRPQAPPGRAAVRGPPPRSGPTGRRWSGSPPCRAWTGSSRSRSSTRGDAWTLPNGSVLVQTLSLDLVDDAGKPARKRVETRLLVRQQGEWTGYSYRWNAEQTDAELVPAAGAAEEYEVADPSDSSGHRDSGLAVPLPHRVPGLPLPRRRLRPELHPAPARPRPRLRRRGRQPAPHARAHRRLQGQAARRGREDRPRLVDPYDAKAPLEARVRSYLHVNCSTCHVKEGGGNAHMELGLATPTDRMRLIDEVPEHARFDIADARLVAPGSPERSVLLPDHAQGDRPDAAPGLHRGRPQGRQADRRMDPRPAAFTHPIGADSR